VTTYPRTTFAETVAAGRLFSVSKPYKRKDRPIRPWVVEFRDPVTDKPHKRSFKTEREAWQFHNRVEDDRDGLRCGSLTRRQVLVGAKGLADIKEQHAAYLGHLRSLGRSVSVVANAESVLRRLIAHAGWSKVKDITQGQCELWLESFSPNCRAAYIRIIRTWVRWLVKGDHLPADPLEHLEPPRETERKRKRTMTPAELDAMVSCPDIAPYRRLWYWIAGKLGLRHAEILRLHWRHVDFDLATITLPAEITKTGRSATLPIPTALMQALREARQMPDVKIIPSTHRLAVRVFRNDLLRAGIKPTQGGTLMLSSFRKSFCTHLAKRGVDLRTAQRLMRHSNVNMTSKIYTEVTASDMREAVEKLA
jgi:integrase